MIVFHREIPFAIRAREALLRRLPPSHPKIPEIEAELSNFKSGFKGEQSIDYYLDFLPDEEFFILHGLRLPFKHYFFQIDTLILSKSFFLLIEVKNLFGTVILDDTFGQLIRIKDDGEKEVFKDPVKQVQLQQYQLSKLLQDIKIPSIPLEHLVVFSNSNTLLQIQNNDSNYVQKVITSQNLFSKIDIFKRQYKREIFTQSELRKVGRNLVKKHIPSKPKILQNHMIDKSEIIAGVLCPHCIQVQMKRIARSWECPQCKFHSKNNHIDALKDYSLLINPQITRREMQEYLGISREDAALRLLNTMKLKITGSNKDRKYLLEF